MDLKKWQPVVAVHLSLFFHFFTCMLHHFEHQPVSVCRSAFVFKCLYLSAFKYESVYLNPNPGYVKWCGISGLGSIKTAFSLPPFFFLEISPKAILVDNNVSICVYACKYVSVYQLEGELIRALGISLSSHTFPTRTVLPKMEIEHWGLDLLISSVQ